MKNSPTFARIWSIFGKFIQAIFPNKMWPILLASLESTGAKFRNVSSHNVLVSNQGNSIDTMISPLFNLTLSSWLHRLRHIPFCMIKLRVLESTIVWPPASFLKDNCTLMGIVRPPSNISSLSLNDTDMTRGKPVQVRYKAVYEINIYLLYYDGRKKLQRTIT